MTVWLLVHRSAGADAEQIGAKTIGFFASRAEALTARAGLIARFESYKRAADGFAVYELPVDHAIDESLSNEILHGRNAVGAPE